MYFYEEEGGTPTPYMGAHCRHLANTISHLNYLLPRRCGLMSNYFDHLFLSLFIRQRSIRRYQGETHAVADTECDIGLLIDQHTTT